MTAHTSRRGRAGEIRRAGRRALRLAGVTARGYLDDRDLVLSAAIAYFGLFAVFP